ncbi:MAG TPA: gamma-glutamyltransferase family protein, partial [Isosphaeraceae bacterium]|nr:gamma-glutamyltransferase family protein [Isosphaeraceae bacterium]
MFKDVKRRHCFSGACIGLLAVVFGSSTGFAQSPVQYCNATPTPPFCSAVPGDRSEGWAQQKRSEVMAQHGIVTTSQPLAAQAGLEILKQGGNAIDAAVATAAMLNLVEPMNVGMGGDLFAIVYIAAENKIHVLNASGKAPTGATLARYNSLGYSWNPANFGPGSGMPGGGILSVTVPGAAWGWDEVVRKYGRLSLKEDLEQAAEYAEDGFPVSERISNDWHLPNALPLVHCCTALDQDSVNTWYVNGKGPAPGQIFKNPDLARSFRLLQKHGRDAFYKGEIASAIVAKSTALGGTMTMADLANYSGEWVTPAQTSYHGFQVAELPPPSQAWNVAEMLNILEACVPKWVPGQTLASLGPANPEFWHLIVEAKKLSYADLYAYNGDPDFVNVPLGTLLSKSYAASLCGKVDPHHASGTSAGGNVGSIGDTIVLSTADRWGNMVSWVNSNFAGFGSGITVPGYGFILHNRGSLFTLNPNSPNVIMPQKRPYNTLSAGFAVNDDVRMAFQLMGGDMQSQGHMQVLVNMIDLGANLQAATDMARFFHSQVSNTLSLETELYN